MSYFTRYTLDVFRDDAPLSSRNPPAVPSSMNSKPFTPMLPLASDPSILPPIFMMTRTISSPSTPKTNVRSMSPTI